MKAYIYTATLSILLMGCNSNDETSSPAIPKQGIYTNDVDNTLMFIDTSRQEEPIVLIDRLNHELYIIKKGVNFTNSFIGNGLYQISGNSSEPGYNSIRKIEARFESDEVTISGLDINGNIIAYNLSKSDAPFKVSDLFDKTLGYSLLWDFKINGTFSIIDEDNCMLNGQLSDRGYYSNAVNIVITNCDDPTDDASNYEIVFAPMTLAGYEQLHYLMQTKDSSGLIRKIKWGALIF